MKRILNDTESKKSMVKIEKEVAKIFGKKQQSVTASWNGGDTIEVKIND